MFVLSDWNKHPRAPWCHHYEYSTLPPDISSKEECDPPVLHPWQEFHTPQVNLFSWCFLMNCSRHIKRHATQHVHVHPNCCLKYWCWQSQRVLVLPKFMVTGNIFALNVRRLDVSVWYFFQVLGNIYTPNKQYIDQEVHTDVNLSIVGELM